MLPREKRQKIVSFQLSSSSVPEACEIVSGHSLPSREHLQKIVFFEWQSPIVTKSSMITMIMIVVVVVVLLLDGDPLLVLLFKKAFWASIV